MQLGQHKGGSSPSSSLCLPVRGVHFHFVGLQQPRSEQHNMAWASAFTRFTPCVSAELRDYRMRRLWTTGADCWRRHRALAHLSYRPKP